MAREARTWRTGRATAGALGLMFALLYLTEGRNLEFGRLSAPGPAVFPLIVGLLLAAVSIGVIADAVLSREPGRASFPKGTDLRRIGAAFGLFVAYIVLFNLLGFLVATALLVAAYTRIVGRVAWWQSATCAVGLTASVWIVFVLILGVRLPWGIWI